MSLCTLSWKIHRLNVNYLKRGSEYPEGFPCLPHSTTWVLVGNEDLHIEERGLCFWRNNISAANCSFPGVTGDRTLAEHRFMHLTLCILYSHTVCNPSHRASGASAVGGAFWAFVWWWSLLVHRTASADCVLCLFSGLCRSLWIFYCILP